MAIDVTPELSKILTLNVDKGANGNPHIIISGTASISIYGCNEYPSDAGKIAAMQLIHPDTDPLTAGVHQFGAMPNYIRVEGTLVNPEEVQFGNFNIVTTEA